MARTAPAPNIPPIPGMNPCTWIMGGGGGGGGKGGGKGKGGGGKGGGDGDGDEKDPDGGGKGAGACGQGGPGGCTNCSSQVARGDPVDVLTGQVFTVPDTDLSSPGPFALDIRRSYSVARRTRDVGMGFGWIHSLSWTLEERRGEVVVRAGDGREMRFPRLEQVGDQASVGG